MDERIFRVALIDDDLDIHRFVKAILPKHGFQLFTSPNSKVGLMSTHFQPDLIILDMYMPGGSGSQVHESVRSKFDLAKTPILIFSSMNENEVNAVLEIKGMTPSLCPESKLFGKSFPK